MTYSEFKTAFAILHDNFSGPNDQRRDSRMVSYWGYFKNVADVEVFSRAVQIYLETAGGNTYFPAVGAIIAIMPPTDTQQEFDPADRVSNDWLETLQQKIEKVGIGDKPNER